MIGWSSQRSILVVMSLALGCGQGPSPGAGNPALGIHEHRVAESAASLEVTGIGAAGDVVARLELRIGEVELPEEQLAGTGRTLTVSVAGTQISHASVGLAPLALPAPKPPELTLFLLDPYVASVLEAWDVHVVARSLDEETAYGHGGSCTGFVPPCGGTAYSSCCLQHANGSGERFQAAACMNMSQPSIAERQCKSPGAQTSCGLAGGGGCAVCWSSPIYGGMTFYTTYNAGADACGFDSCSPAGVSCYEASDCCQYPAAACWDGLCFDF
jgi:hypothetical protein